MKIQSMQELMAEMRAVARGERETPPDAARPSAESDAAVARALRRAALEELARLGQEMGIGYEK
jgi:hypothetical protein